MFNQRKQLISLFSFIYNVNRTTTPSRNGFSIDLLHWFMTPGIQQCISQTLSYDRLLRDNNENLRKTSDDCELAGVSRWGLIRSESAVYIVYLSKSGSVLKNYFPTETNRKPTLYNMMIIRITKFIHAIPRVHKNNQTAENYLKFATLGCLIAAVMDTS